jgi:hypothetical protein
VKIDKKCTNKPKNNPLKDNNSREKQKTSTKFNQQQQWFKVI